jgi:hypothetical protein
MNNEVQYHLALNRQAELLRQAANYRRRDGAQSLPSASLRPARHASQSWRSSWLQRSPSRPRLV